jgi:trk system potassium uptake protein
MFRQLQQLWRQLGRWAPNGASRFPSPSRLTTGLGSREQHEFVVIGLGRFGSSVAETLVRGGHDVLAIDLDERRVHHLSAELPHVVQMDATNADALRQIGIETFDTGLVCIGSDFESNLLATVLLLRFGVNRVITKARTRTQRTILESVGAHEVILPEQQAGVHLGRRLAFKHFIEYLEISEGIGVVELRAPPSLWGRTLIDANLRQRYYLNVIAIHRGPEVIVNLHPDFLIQEGDVLAVVGRIEDAEKLRA